MDHIEQEIEGYCDRIRTLERENRALEASNGALDAANRTLAAALENISNAMGNSDLWTGDYSSFGVFAFDIANNAIRAAARAALKAGS